MPKNNSTVAMFKRLDDRAKIPSYATPEAAGMDVSALDGVTIGPGTWAKVRTGLAVEIPPGWELQVRGRSGLAVKQGVVVLNAPGTIDSDYRGEIGVALLNLSQVPVEIKPGDRVAQLVLARAPQAVIEEVAELSSSDRGTGGFGSTGR